MENQHVRLLLKGKGIPFWKIAKVIGISDVSKAVYDCRKLSITKKVLDCLYKFYHSENQSDETITTCMLLYGPKADLDGDGYEVEVEDGFVTKGV